MNIVHVDMYSLIKKSQFVYIVCLQVTLNEFWDPFLHHLKYSLIIFKQEPAVDRTLEFVARFVTSFMARPGGKELKKDGCHSDEEEAQELPLILLKLFSFLLEVFTCTTWQFNIKGKLPVILKKCFAPAYCNAISIACIL